MSAITFKSKGEFDELKSYLKRAQKDASDLAMLDKYGKRGCEILASATPIDTGETARSWTYEVKKTETGMSLSFKNTNIQNGVPVVILLQYGHATKNGGYVQGRDFVNPAIQPLFDELADILWKEVTKT